MARHAHHLDERNRSSAAAGRTVSARYLAWRFDGDDLVVETDHFTFDPDGIDDHLGLASSTEKDNGALSADRRQQHEVDHHAGRPGLPDEPFTWAFVFTKTGLNGPRQGWRECDAESARREQEFAYPGNSTPTRGNASIRRETLMTRYLVPLCGVVVVAGSLITGVNAQSAAAKVHVDAARAAVAPSVANPNRPHETFKALFDQACIEPKLPDTMRTNDRSAVVPRKEWFTFPVEIFDNLHFVGTKTAGVWAVSSSEGIILIDTNFHYSSKELVLGMMNFGLDPNDIKYIIVTHAHDDRYWGAKALQDTYPKARVAMSAADWDIVARTTHLRSSSPEGHGRHRWPEDHARRRDRHVHITPGHTPGTLSMIIEPLTNKKSVASDDGRHVAAIWGGTDPSIGRQGVQYTRMGRR